MTDDQILSTKRAWRFLNREMRRNRQIQPDHLTADELTGLAQAMKVIIPIIGCAVMFLIAGCHSEAVAGEVDMAKIAKIESSGCKYKVGDGGESNGCHQVSTGTLKEYNQFNHTEYTKKDLLNDAISLKIATWYIEKRIPQMLRYYGKPVDLKHKLWAYNAGIGRVVEGVMPEKTKKYLKKYGV